MKSSLVQEKAGTEDEWMEVRFCWEKVESEKKLLAAAEKWAKISDFVLEKMSAAVGPPDSHLPTPTSHPIRPAPLVGASPSLIVSLHFYQICCVR